MDQAKAGADALSAGNYKEAIDHYTAAIEKNPGAVDYYIKRSTAFQRSSQYAKALVDAERAVVLANKRARRELIKDSQLRRAIALFFLGQYANAKFVLDIVKSLDEKEKTSAIWYTKVEQKLKDIPEGDERRNVTTLKLPVADFPDEKTQTNGTSSQTNGTALPAKTVAAPAKSTAPTEKPRNDWYQTNESVTFTLLAKNVPKDKATIQIEKDSLDISYPIGDGKEFNYNLLPLYAEVDPEKSTFRITATKIEVTLKKATPGVKWASLEGEAKSANDGSGFAATCTEPADVPPSYPTSSKKGTKNWDKVAETGWTNDDEYGDGDATSRFFKTLYNASDEDTQRAMRKSYQESGGTVLSTDWSNVSKQTVKPEPPDGMEEKQWEE